MRPPSDAPITRLLVVLVLFGVGGLLLVTGASPTEMPGRDWYAATRQRLLLADLSFRLGRALEWAGHRWNMAVGDQPWELQERAVAEYERQSLAARPNALALTRLGLIYGDRGYTEQARQAMTHAASVDETEAAACFSMAAIYDPTTNPERLRAITVSALASQPSWLATMALLARARRLEDPGLIQQHLQERDRGSQRFLLNLALLALFYGLVGLSGLVCLVTSVLHWGMQAPSRRPRPAAAVAAPWGMVEALEAAGLLYFTMAVLGILAGFLVSLPLMERAPMFVRVGLTVLQYGLLTLVTLAFIVRRMGVPASERAGALGLHNYRWPRMVVAGLVGYGTVLTLLALLGLLLPGQNQAGPLALLAAGSVPLTDAIRYVPTAALLLLLVCVIVPVVEEVIFRGFIYAGLRHNMPVFSAMVASALLFALMHHSLQALLPIGLIGMVLASLYERHRSLVPGIICHALHNTLIFALIQITQ